MKIKCLKSKEPNSGVLEQMESRNKLVFVEIKKGRYIYQETSHPLRSRENYFYSRVYCLEHKNDIIYWLDTFGKNDNHHGFHIGFTWKQHQKFLWMQNEHWFQKEDNIRFIVNVLFLILGVIIAFKQV